MKCEPFDLGNGVTGFVCGRREARKRCSCGELTELVCDYPIGEKAPKPPKVGDARTNIHNRKVFYVWHVEPPKDPQEQRAPEGRVVVSTKTPSFRATPPGALVMTWAKWWERTRPGCDRPVCRRCLVRSGSLDFCAAHGRALAKSAK